MICPACGKPLQEVTIEGIHLDVCKEGCGGIWFDNYELMKMDEAHEFTDANLVDVLAGHPMVHLEPSGERYCPKCKDVVMMRHFFSVKRDVEVDECPNCGGHWLDEGELFKIREQYKTEEERDQAASDYFAELYDQDLGAMRKESQQKLEQAERFAHMFRLITPSYYFSRARHLTEPGQAA